MTPGTTALAGVVKEEMEQDPRCVEEEVEDLVAANDGEEKKEATEVLGEEEAPGLEGMVINCLGAKHQEEAHYWS